MSQILDTPGFRPSFLAALPVRLAVIAARLLSRIAPSRIVAVLNVLRRGARNATPAQTLAARQAVTAISTLCAGRYCLQRSLATALLCRLRGHWPTWCTGVRTPPFAAHAWVQV